MDPGVRQVAVGETARARIGVLAILKDGASVVAAIGAVVFAAGAIAMWSHDRMVGFPTTWTSYNAYLRVGTMMVPDTAVMAVFAVNQWLNQVLTAVPMVVFAGAAVGIIAAASFVGRAVRKIRADVLVYVVLGSHAAALVFGAIELDRLLGVISSANTGLVFSLPRIPDGAASIISQVRFALVRGDVDAASMLYGARVVWLGVLGGALALAWWIESHCISDIELTRLALRAEGPTRVPTLGRSVSRTIAPIARAIVAFGVIMLPPAYGVLRLGASPPCVELQIAGSSGAISEQPNGFLLTDLATDPGEVQLAKWERAQMVLRIYPRSTVRTVLLKSGCGTFYSQTGT